MFKQERYMLNGNSMSVLTARLGIPFLLALSPQLEISPSFPSTDAKSGGLPEKTVTLQMTDQNSTANESDLKVRANAGVWS